MFSSDFPCFSSLPVWDWYMLPYRNYVLWTFTLFLWNNFVLLAHKKKPQSDLFNICGRDPPENCQLSLPGVPHWSTLDQMEKLLNLLELIVLTELYVLKGLYNNIFLSNNQHLFLRSNKSGLCTGGSMVGINNFQNIKSCEQWLLIILAGCCSMFGKWIGVKENSPELVPCLSFAFGTALQSKFFSSLLWFRCSPFGGFCVGSW